MRIGKKALLTSISKSVKHVSVFLLSILLARYLTLDDYGSYLQVMLIANMAIYISLMGVPSSVYYFLNKVQNKKNFLLRTILIIHFLAILSASIGLLAKEQIATILNNDRLIDITFVYVLFILFQIPIKLFEPIMISSDKVLGFIWVNLVFNALFFFAVAIPLLVYETTEYVFYSLIVFFIVQYIFVYIGIFKAYLSLADSSELGANEDRSSVLSQLRYSLPIGVSGALSEASRIVDKVIISNYFDPAQLAIYARGAMGIPMLNVVINSLGNLLMPKFVTAYSENRIEDIIKYWHSSTIIIAFAVYPMMVLLIAVADKLIPLLFTDKFLESVIIFQLYSLTFLARITTYDLIIRAIGVTSVLLRITVIAISLNIFLTILLVEMYGLVGAVIATIITNFIVRAEQLRIIKNLLHIKFTQVFPWPRLLRILVVSLLAVIPVLIYKLAFVGYGNLVDFLLSLIIYASTFLIINRLHNLLDKYEISALEGVLPRAIINLIASRS